MSADFCASYVSGALGICIGNPLDILKVRLQAGTLPNTPQSLTPTQGEVRETYVRALLRGSAAPIFAYGALNSLLFVTYNRTLKLLDPTILNPLQLENVTIRKIWLAGAVGGAASWIVSAPSELIKCRTQLALGSGPGPGPGRGGSSWVMLQRVWSLSGLRGLYHGGMVTLARDSVGYGFYFSAYEVCKRGLRSRHGEREGAGTSAAAAVDTLISGGVAGVVTWASVYPLDVIKTRIQTRPDFEKKRERGVGQGFLASASMLLRREGFGALYRGLGVCTVRAFLVNAIQWYAYEGLMTFLSDSSNGPG